ncbi:glycosyltransferase family 39 protein [Curtobacterium sp. MCPF17_052]|uniref:glycosyltransferase family 39 protein n=1 Tax=Curtobacterium sp. MCPF17_052 TaxID=2175655 RepID=UPI0024DF4C86|nr:glycosyltransferase family 39 protein [Curtobacterium sp. MCPF17_052]WIB13005.1 glycosyltransferase family 39 protein [Curtobacterium sp. MCPF17_052]
MPTEPGTAVRSSRRERLSITAIVLAFVAVLVLWASLQPLFGSPDEIAHWDAAVQLAMGQGWPDPTHLKLLSATRAGQAEGLGFLQVDRPTLEALLASAPGNGATNQMTQHPPTWYAMAAGVLHLIGYMHLRWDLDLYAMRLMNVAVLGTLPLVVWAAVRRVTRSPRTALVAAASLFLIPQVGFIGTSATNDTPVIILGAVVVWLVCRIVTGDRGWVTLVALAVAASAAVSFKATALPLVPFAVVAVVIAGQGRSRWLRGAVVLVVPVLATSWWWVRNVLVFHTLQPAGLPQSIRTEQFAPGGGPRRRWFREHRVEPGDELVLGGSTACCSTPPARSSSQPSASSPSGWCWCGASGAALAGRPGCSPSCRSSRSPPGCRTTGRPTSGRRRSAASRAVTTSSSSASSRCSARSPGAVSSGTRTTAADSVGPSSWWRR